LEWAVVYLDADKSLARPGRKQATATKLFTFASHSKNSSEVCPSNQVSATAMTSASDEKWRPFSCFLSQVGLRTYQHPCTSVERDQLPNSIFRVEAAVCNIRKTFKLPTLFCFTIMPPFCFVWKICFTYMVIF